MHAALHMRVLVFIVAVAALARAGPANSANSTDAGGWSPNYAPDTRSAEKRARDRRANALSFETCEYQRSDVISCAIRFGDTNGDAYIDAAEIGALVKRYVGAGARTLLALGSWVGAVESVDVMVKKCDYDGDGRISLSDFERSYETCLAYCSRVKLLYDVVCSRAIVDERRARRKQQ